MAPIASRVKTCSGRAAGDPNAAGDVRGRLGKVQRPQLAAKRDALLQLAQRRFVQPVGQLRLPGQDHVQQLRRRRLDVAEQPDLLEQLVRDALRLVEDERAEHARRLPLEQEAAELEQKPRLRAAPPPGPSRTPAPGTRRTPAASASGC